MQTLGKKRIACVSWGERAHIEAFHASCNHKVVDSLPCSQVHQLHWFILAIQSR